MVSQRVREEIQLWELAGVVDGEGIDVETTYVDPNDPRKGIEDIQVVMCTSFRIVAKFDDNRFSFKTGGINLVSFEFREGKAVATFYYPSKEELAFVSIPDFGDLNYMSISTCDGQIMYESRFGLGTLGDPKLKKVANQMVTMVGTQEPVI